MTNASGTAITNSAHIANVNPIRYRGYFYDTETKLYYCSSRYYDPQTRRFINADTEDALHATPGEFTDKNLFAYCDNNPVMRSDIVLQLLSFVAENERINIRQRQTEGIAAAKKRGVKFGRPVKELTGDFDEIVRRWEHKELSTQEILKTYTISESTFYRRLREYRLRKKTRK